MCGRRHQAHRCGRRQTLSGALIQTAIQSINHSIPQSTPRYVQNGQTTGIAGLTRSINDIKLNDNKEVDAKFDAHPPMYTEETKDGFLPNPPAYTEQPQPQPTFQHQPAGLTTTPAISEKSKFTLPEPLSKSTTTNPQIIYAMANLNQALEAYANGSGRKILVKRARKALLNELYEVEIERRKRLSEGAYLRCGEKSAVWRELTGGVGEQISVMIEGAKGDRRRL